MMKREQFFECEYSSDHQPRTAHVRAWTAAEAKSAFIEMLGAEGIHDSGRVVVTPVRTSAERVSLVGAVPTPRHA